MVDQWRDDQDFLKCRECGYVVLLCLGPPLRPRAKTRQHKGPPRLSQQPHLDVTSCLGTKRELSLRLPLGWRLLNRPGFAAKACGFCQFGA